MVLTNCTISGNSVSGASAIGGGIDNNNQSGNLTLNNTIVAGNIAVSGAGDPDICGAVESISSSNLIGIGTADMTGISNGLNHNHVGTSLSPVNAELAPLANNGGATQTMAIAPGSLALDAGSNSLAVDANGNPLTADQRGQPRIVNGTVDIGAFEYQGTAPSPISPASGTIAAAAGYDLPTFSWSIIQAPNHYALYVLDSTSGSTLVNRSNLSVNSFVPTSVLTPGHKYLWYAGAVNASGATTWSTAQTFTLAGLAAPTLSGPSGTITASTGYDMPTFSWSALPGAGHYFLVVVDDNTGGLAVDDANVTGTSFTPSTAQALTPGHHFTWYVLAMSTNSAAYNYLASGQTFTLAGLAAPTLSGPSGTITASTGYDMPTFSWSASPGAGHYYLVVIDGNTGAAVVNDNNVAGTSFTLSTAQALTPGHHYTWYVLAMSTNNESYNFLASGQTFTLGGLAAPTLGGPSGTITAGTGYDMPTFSWSASPGAGHYFLVAVDDNTGGLAIDDANVTGTSFTPSTAQALTPGHHFTWYVLAMSTNNESYNYLASGQSFTLAGLAAPTLSGPSGTITASTGYDMPTFSWSASPGAGHYYLVVIDGNTGAAVVNDANVSGTSFTLSTAQALTPGHHYTWYVLAMSTNSAAYNFLATGQTFTLAALTAPTQSGPSGNILSTEPTYSWSASTGADHYYLYVYDDTTKTVAINDPDVSGTTFTPGTALTVGHQYTWYVFAMSTNDKAFGYVSTGQTFEVT